MLSSFLAWVGSLPIALVPFFSIFASSLANRFGCRTVSVTGCMAFALSLVTASLAKNLTVLYVAFSVIGIGASCALVSGLVMVRKCFDKREAFALGIVSTGKAWEQWFSAKFFNILLTLPAGEVPCGSWRVL